MMNQVWFEMAEIRRRKFASSVWIPLRSDQTICEEGRQGDLSFNEEFFVAESLDAPIALKSEATQLRCSATSSKTVSTMGGYISDDAYEYMRSMKAACHLIRTRKCLTCL